MKDEPLILLAEDNDDDVFLIQRAFERGRILNRIEVVRTGAEAIAYLEGQGRYADRAQYPLPGLLLLDLRMPGIDGFEVLLRIQERPELDELRVVVLTASTDVRDMNQAFALGADSFLIKPADFLRFVEFTEALAGRWRWINHTPHCETAPNLPLIPATEFLTPPPHSPGRVLQPA